MILIHGKYYDLEHFNHPGGRTILELCKNEPDCTALFESYHAFCDMTKITNIMKNLQVGIDTNNENMFLFKTDGFYNTCKKEIKEKLSLTRTNTKADINWLTTVFYSSLLFIFLQYLFFIFNNGLLKCICGFLSGITIMSFGYNVLHDSSHYSISYYPFINNLISHICQPFILSNHILWSYHHCIRHHQYTGSIEYDPDMRNSQPFFRKSKALSVRKNEFTKRFIGIKLLFFNLLFPGTMLGQSLSYHLVWARKNKLWNMKLPDLYFNEWSIFEYLIAFLFCIFEIYYTGIYFIFHIIGTNVGFFIGSAPDHDMYCTHQEMQNTDYSKNDWGEIQVRHSANFMKNNTFFTKFYGGINYQIEHHLFPTLNGHKLKMISPIVEKCCKQFDIPYNSIDSPIKVFQEIKHTYENVHL